MSGCHSSHVTKPRLDGERNVMHIKSRNDEFVTLSMKILKENDMLHWLDEDDRNRLSDGKVVWVDEWVRRSNGDRYELIPDDMEPEALMRFCLLLGDNGRMGHTTVNMRCKKW